MIDLNACAVEALDAAGVAAVNGGSTMAVLVLVGPVSLSLAGAAAASSVTQQDGRSTAAQ